MNRSVKDMTKLLGTNKNVIYRIITKLGLKPVQDGQNNTTKVYSDETYLEIKKEFERLQGRHQDARDEVSVGSDNSDLVVILQNQVKRYETEIDRLNKVIEDKDATIKELTSQLTRTVENSHLEKIRDQELLAREQSSKLLLTAQSQTRFNLFKPSTWKRSKPVQAPDLEPLTEPDSSGEN